MSNYRYIRDIIEKIAEKGNVPKEDIADTMKYARMDSNRIRDVDEYVNNRLRYPHEAEKDLKTFLEDSAFGRGEDAYLDTLAGDDPEYGVSLPTHNKYNKYLPIRSRIEERENVLAQLINDNSPDYRYAGNPKKAQLYEALLERLKEHPLYDERNNIHKYI